MATPERGDSRGAGGRVKLGQAGALRETPRKCVLSRTGADDHNLHRASVLLWFDDGVPRNRQCMQEPGLDEHEWITEWEQLSPFLEESPIEAIPEVHRLITEMMEARGFELDEPEGEELKEPEITRTYIAAREVKDEIESGDSLDLGDVPGAVEAYRELYQDLLDYGATSGTP
jgi:hypothetical protein